MLAEHPKETTKRFIHSWRNVEPNRLGEEIKSVFSETHRQPDEIAFIVKEGKLIDPATNKPFDFERETPTEIAEGHVWDDLKTWANKNKRGKAVWLSPQSLIYPANKAVIYEINWTNDFPPKKILQSTTILFDADKEFCLQVAEKLNPLIKNVKDSEFLRSHLFKKDADFSLLEILEIIGGNKKETIQTPSQETIKYFVGEIKSGRDASFIVEEMNARGIIGNYSISCSASVSSLLLNNSRFLNFSQSREILPKKFDEIKKCVNCPFCHQTVDAGIKDNKIYCLTCGRSAPYKKSAA